MTQGLFTPAEVSDLIRAGKSLLLAGDAKLLSRLPAGNWIGGSTPFFILYPENRATSYDKIFVSQLPGFVSKTEIMEYDETNIRNIFNDGPQNGFTVLIMPFASPVAVEYATNATDYRNFAAYPVCGWLAGQPLEVIMTEKSYSASGAGTGISSEKAVAMHVSLPESKYAEIHIFNPYKQGKGDSIQFDYSSMTLKDAIINGEKRNFAEYLREIGYNMQMPFVANYSGAMINVVCCGIGESEVQMSAPVFKSVDYRIAMIDEEIVEPSLVSDRIVFSVTCIGNFIQPDICTQYLKKMNGPVVYGEIAYQQVGQTTVYVTVDDTPLNTETI
ncbi:MAG: hypothetical protein LBL24_10870 [Bacteroidales bacterium]|jgi:hypothetical protein|nr:hypothetical protein [Bacteroidales bacterium]